MASVRSLDNALEVSADVQAASGLPQAKITNDDGRTHIPDNGRIIRNLIHGADTVMSHILHFYHLAALDYVDARALGPYFSPAYTETQLVNFYNSTANTKLTNDYVEALTIRRRCHTMGAILSGRQPIQHAVVAGGVTTLPTVSDMALFDTILNDVRRFINTVYVPDVLFVATTTTTTIPLHTWTEGPGTGNLLSYGEYPCQPGTGNESLLIARGLWTGGSTGSMLTATTPSIGPTALLDMVYEDTAYSYYNNPSGQGLKPHSGETVPDVSKVNNLTQYSWLKAPRIVSGTNSYVCEVGPLARMAISALGGVTTASIANDNGPGFYGLGPAYSAANIVVYALTAFLGGTANAVRLFSILGRHAARALECKLVADTMYTWSQSLQTGGNLTRSTYVYGKLPTKPKKGSGWAEAPRGALGHWITIDKKRIANYQCVVPSTWCHSPKDALGRKGAAETVLTQLTGFSGVSPESDGDILKIVRALHPFDFCIACAVHVVRPDGSTIAKFKMELDKGVTRLPDDAEI
jgi:hydrogenase large subunit